MIIDCHTHLGRNEHITSSVSDLLSSMDGAKIDKALVFAGELNNVTTSEMLAEIKPHRDRLHGVASWDFEYESRYKGQLLAASIPEQLDYMASLYEAKEIVAVKFYTGYYHHMPCDLKWPLTYLNRVGCPAIFHCGDCLNSVRCAKLKYAHPLNIDEVAVDYPNMNFIIAHMGYPWIKDTAEVCYKNKNVFTDISGFVYGEFDGQDKTRFKKSLDEFLEIAGSDKLLFGTDYPISNQHSYIEALEWLSVNSINKKMSEIFTPQYMSQNVKRAFRV